MIKIAAKSIVNEFIASLKEKMESDPNWKVEILSIIDEETVSIKIKPRSAPDHVIDLEKGITPDYINLLSQIIRGKLSDEFRFSFTEDLYLENLEDFSLSIIITIFQKVNQELLMLHKKGIINGHYVEMLYQAKDIKNILKNTQVRWIYELGDDHHFFNHFNYKFHKVYERKYFKNPKRKRIIKIVTPDYFIKLLIPSIFKDMRSLKNALRTWSIENEIEISRGFNSQSAVFLRFVMHALYKMIWEYSLEGWIVASQKFILNEFITLKLENNETIIYVNGNRFLQCKSLMINIPKNQVKAYDDINSIDEALEVKLMKNPHGSIRSHIDPETEFWGHCSNLQVWHENEYDTRLLHSNIAFPLLKELVKAGDPLARKRFKEEIAMRLESGSESIFKFLREGNYLYFFKKNELEIILLNILRQGNISFIQTMQQDSHFMYLQVDVSTIYEPNSELYRSIESLFLFERTRDKAKDELRRLEKFKGGKKLVKELVQELGQKILQLNGTYKLHGFLNMVHTYFNDALPPKQLKQLVLKLLEGGSSWEVSSIIQWNYLALFSREELKFLNLKPSSYLFKHPFLHEILIHREEFTKIDSDMPDEPEYFPIKASYLIPGKECLLKFYEKDHFLNFGNYEPLTENPQFKAQKALEEGNFWKISLNSNYENYYYSPKARNEKLIPLIHVTLHDFLVKFLGEEDLMIYFQKIGISSLYGTVKYYNPTTRMGCELLPKLIEFPSLRRKDKAQFKISQKRKIRRGLIADPNNYKKITDF